MFVVTQLDYPRVIAIPGQNFFETFVYDFLHHNVDLSAELCGEM